VVGFGLLGLFGVGLCNTRAESFPDPNPDSHRGWGQAAFALSYWAFVLFSE